MQLHQLKRTSPNKKSRRVGRGGLRGKTSGRGHKGQKARAGAKIRPAMRDEIKKIPKRRGYGKNRARTVHDNRTPVVVVNLAALERTFTVGDVVTPETLRAAKLIRVRKGVNVIVKILGTGKLTKKLSVSGVMASESAKEAITAAGGTLA